MRYNTIVKSDESGLIQIIKAAEKFEESRFLQGIQQRCYTAEDIQWATDRVREYQQKLNTEARALAYFSEHFLKQYATNNNQCFEMAQLLFNRIRSTLKASRKVFREFCPIRRKQLPAEAEQPSVYERSALSHGACNRDLFGILSYEDSVQTLYQDLQTFFTTVSSTLALCHQMIRSERAIRDDGERCELIYRECQQRALSGIKDVTAALASCGAIPESELADRKARARSMKDFCRENYHRWNKEQFRTSVAVEVLRSGRCDGLTDVEALLWPNDHERALRVREVVARFDELEGAEGLRGKLSSGLLVEFLKWCGLEQAKEKKLYEEYFCKEYRGRLQVVKWKTVSQERLVRKESGISNEEMVQTFEKLLEKMRMES